MSESENTMLETSCLLVVFVTGISCLGVVAVILIGDAIGKGWL